MNSNYGTWWKYKYDTTLEKIQYSISTDYNSTTKVGKWTGYADTSYRKFKEPGKDEINSVNNTAVAELEHTYYSYKISSKIGNLFKYAVLCHIDGNSDSQAYTVRPVVLLSSSVFTTKVDGTWQINI